MKWITNDELGVIAFATRKECADAVPSFRQVRCEFAMGFRGWLAIDPYGNQTVSTIQTPDGRKIPVVSGWTQGGRVIGMRAGTPMESLKDAFRSIMANAIEQGLQVHSYNLNPS